MNLYESISSNLKESYSEKDIKGLKEILSLRENVEPKIADIIDRWAATQSKSFLYGNRSYLYRQFQKDKSPDNIILRNINLAFTEEVINNIQAIGHSTFPYSGGREIGFLIIYKDNILECSVYDSYAYIPGETNMTLMMNNEFKTDNSTFLSKSIDKQGKATANEIQKCLLPIPNENNELQDMKDFLNAHASEQLQLPLDGGY